MTENPTVHQAWSAVMNDVQSIEKGEFNKAQGFRFRGIDAVMDVIGPALRKHGVIVVPTGTDLQSETYETAKGTPMRNSTATMQYTVYGPSGDYFVGVSFGESADAGDKSVTKAQSVALRTFLLQSLMVPTGDPDPDASSHERASAPPPPPPPPPDPDLELALAELGDACAALKLDAHKTAGQFLSQYRKPARQARPKQIRDFITKLHETAEKAKKAAQE